MLVQCLSEIFSVLTSLIFKAAKHRFVFWSLNVGSANNKGLTIDTTPRGTMVLQYTYIITAYSLSIFQCLKFNFVTILLLPPPI